VGGSEKSRLLWGCVWWLCQLCLWILFSLNTMLFVDKQMNNAMTSAVTNFWCHKLITIVNKKRTVTENFICNRYGERLHILNTENIKICLRFLSYLLHMCKKIDFFICQGSAVTMPKVRWVLSNAFCSKFHTLSSSAKILIIS